MTDNYAALVSRNLSQLFSDPPQDLATRLGARQQGTALVFRAFGKPCRLDPSEIFLGNRPAAGVRGVLISLYALHATAESIVEAPFRAFKDLPDSMPYAGAFVSHAEQILVPAVHAIEAARDRIVPVLAGSDLPGTMGGDFGFVLRPLPKISIAYIFYLADEDFPPSATCLFSANAHRFLPTAALADVGEYTSREMLALSGGSPGGGR